MQTIKFRLVNQSLNIHNDDAVIFLLTDKKDKAKDEILAWKVIKNCRYNQYHPFNYSKTTFVSFSDEYGNESALIAAQAGERFEVIMSPSGAVIQHKAYDECETDIQVTNNLSEGSITVNLQKVNKVVDSIKDISPGQKVDFGTKFTFWVTMEGQISEGSPVSQFAIDNAQQILLDNIQAGDIVKRGGQPGPTSTRINFLLENTVPL